MVPAWWPGLVNVLLHRIGPAHGGPRLSRRPRQAPGRRPRRTRRGGRHDRVVLAPSVRPGHVGDLPALVQRMAEVLDETGLWLRSARRSSSCPTRSGRRAAQGRGVGVARRRRAELRKTGGEVGRGLLHAGIGIAIGLLIFFATPSRPRGRSVGRSPSDSGGSSRRSRRWSSPRCGYRPSTRCLTAIYLFVVLASPASTCRCPAPWWR